MDHLSISFPCPAEDSCGSRASGSENRRRFKMKPAVFGPCAAVAWISSRVEPTKHGEMTPPKKRKLDATLKATIEKPLDIVGTGAESLISGNTPFEGT